MIKLRTLLLLVPFMTFMSCSDDEGDTLIDSTSPILSECSISSDVMTQNQEVQGSQEALLDVISKNYAYEGEMMKSYTYGYRQVYTDTLGVDSVSADVGYQLDFEYEDGNLKNVTSGSESVLSVQNVDGRPYSMTLFYTDGSDAEFIFEYDGSGRVAAIQTDDISQDSTISLTFSYTDENLVKMDLFFGGSNEIYHEYSYFDNVKNPYNGLNFYAIALIEEGGLFFNIYNTTFSTSLVQDIEFGESIGEGRWQKEIVYQDQLSYTTNSKGYPTAGSVPAFSSNGVNVTFNQQFSYVNCD